MKKTLIALAAVAATGAAFAQATITGAINARYESTSSTSTGIGFGDALLNVAASEDLGGGLKASANFTYNGAGRTVALVNDGQTVALEGGFGKLSVSSYESKSKAVNALSGVVSLSTDLTAQAAHGLGATNAQAVIYQLPSFVTGLTAKVATSETQATNNESNVKGVGVTKKTNSLSLDYANGPVAVGGNFKYSTDQATNVSSNTREFFATYNLGVAKVGYGYNKGSANADATTLLGLSAPIGANLTVGVDYAKYGSTKGTQYGANYSLSKRTTFNVSTGKATDASTDNQYRVGVTHSF
jgi:predicted porin